MLTKADEIALLKVLIAAAWVDSRLTQSGLNYIKLLAQKFRLTDNDRLQLQPYLEDAPTQERNLPEPPVQKSVEERIRGDGALIRWE